VSDQRNGISRCASPAPPSHLSAGPDSNGKIFLRYWSTLLIDAIRQQFAREVVGIIHCAKCPAPNCGRWFLRSQTRSDRQYCSPTCRTRVWRSVTFNTPAGSP
jgi:hypothetical protein